MKTAMQELLQILESKILPCDDDNSYVYGMNVAHANLIYNIKNGFLEKEKEQIKPLVDALEDIINWNEDLEEDWGDAGYRAKDALETYNQNK
jgi:hypothetical protein